MEHLITLKLTPDHEGNAPGQLEVELQRDNSLQLVKTPEQQSFFLDANEVRKLLTAAPKRFSMINVVRWASRCV
jgi:hypothetical protein